MQRPQVYQVFISVTRDGYIPNSLGYIKNMYSMLDKIVERLEEEEEQCLNFNCRAIKEGKNVKEF